MRTEHFQNTIFILQYCDPCFFFINSPVEDMKVEPLSLEVVFCRFELHPRKLVNAIETIGRQTAQVIDNYYNFKKL